MHRKSRSFLLLAVLTTVTLSGCLLLTAEQFQSLTLLLKLTEAVPAGQSVEVHRAFYPGEVKVRRNYIKVFGRLELPAGAEMPTSVTARVESEDLATEQIYNRFTIRIPVQPDGSFFKFRRFAKNLRPRTLQTFFIEVAGADIPTDTKVALCVDVVKKRAEAAQQEDCGPGDGNGGGGGGGGGDPDMVIVDVLDNSFDPKSVTIQPGDTVRWVLRGQDSSHTATEMNGTWDSGFVFNAAGAFFERTFPISEDGQTFQYYCVTHQGCCEMQGSVRVGANAPDPGDGYT